MTVKALPGVGIYHHRVRADSTTDEHVTQTPIRQTSTAYILYCAPCDALTVIDRGHPSEELRNTEAAIASGHRVKTISEITDATTGHPRFDHDPLELAREDGDKRIPAKVPVEWEARMILARSLRV